MSAKQLTQKMEKALSKAKVSIRQPDPDAWEECEIVDIYELGKEEGTGTPIQPLEVKFPGDEADVIRNYVVKGADTITTVFGEPGTNQQLSKVTYSEDGVPEKVSLPNIKANKQGAYWFQISKK
jgi:hypothetical protein